MKIGKLNIFHFWIIFLLILVLPVAKEWRMIVSGDRVTGTVVEIRKLTTGPGVLIGGIEYRPIIEYDYEGTRYQMVGPENTRYDVGTELPLIIHPRKRDKIIIATLAGFYIQPRSVSLIIVMLLWIAIFSTIVQVQKGKVYRKR